MPRVLEHFARWQHALPAHQWALILAVAAVAVSAKPVVDFERKLHVTIPSSDWIAPGSPALAVASAAAPASGGFTDSPPLGPIDPRPRPPTWGAD
jgi:hypothetical protein